MNTLISIKKFINQFLYKLGYVVYKTNYKIPFPVEFSDEEREIISSIENYTMTNRKRIFTLINIFKEINLNNITGDFVECGVWRGGNIILLQKFNDLFQTNKMIYGYDTFEGMTEAGEFDIDLRSVKSQELLKTTKKINDKKNIWAYCDVETVNLNISKNFKEHNIKLIKGDVGKTLLNNQNLPDKISILRLDTDFYDSTKVELEILYPKLSKGGYLIIDDYGHFNGCKKAVDEYFKNSKMVLHYSDYSCRYFRKEE